MQLIYVRRLNIRYYAHLHYLAPNYYTDCGLLPYFKGAAKQGKV